MPSTTSDKWPDQKGFATFEEYALACSVWMRENPDQFILVCTKGEPILYFEDMQAGGPGHIYSNWGQRAFEMHGICEYHLDEESRIEQSRIEAQAINEFQLSDPSSASKSPNITQSGDSVIGDDEFSYDFLSADKFSQLWDENTFKNDDPNRPEPM